MSKYKHKAMKQYSCLNITKYIKGNETTFMSKYIHKAMKQHWSKYETIFMSKYKHKAMKQHLCL